MDSLQPNRNKKSNLINRYTIERIIHGMKAIYNDIQPWNHQEILHLFSADPEHSDSYQVKNKTELENLFRNEKFCSAPHIQVN
jgi:pyruvate decarboxylase